MPAFTELLALTDMLGKTDTGLSGSSLLSQQLAEPTVRFPRVGSRYNLEAIVFGRLRRQHSGSPARVTRMGRTTVLTTAPAPTVQLREATRCESEKSQKGEGGAWWP